MCRMLGYVTRTPTTLADLLGEQDLQDFAELSRKHGRLAGRRRYTRHVVPPPRSGRPGLVMLPPRCVRSHGLPPGHCREVVSSEADQLIRAELARAARQLERQLPLGLFQLYLEGARINED